MFTGLTQRKIFALMTSVSVELRKSYQGCLFDVELEDPLEEMGAWTAGM